MLQILRDCIEKIPSFRDQLTKEKYEDAQGKVIYLEFLWFEQIILILI